MKKFCIIILFLLSIGLEAQEKTLRGKITYLSGDVVYTSLGRDVGLKDSSLAFVFSKKDTVALLRVFALSSKSSVCRILRTKRTLIIDDLVLAVVEERDSVKLVRNQPSTVDSTIAQVPETTTTRIQPTAREQVSPSFVALQGRLGVQYFTNHYSYSAQDITQPAVILDLRGQFRDSHISFAFYGNFRSLVYGTARPFSSSSQSQTRIYRVSIDYDDGTNRAFIGRSVPSLAPTIGYIDGISISRKIGDFNFGTAAGFEPDFTQRGFSSERKKLSLFGNYETGGPTRTMVSMAYARTYFHSSLDREVVSTSMSMAPSNELFIFAQGDVDLRMKSGRSLIYSPKVTSLYANANYRFTDFMSVGVGYNAWRPTYSFSSVSFLADSLIDRDVRTTPSLSVNFYLPRGISLSNTYSPRSSSAGFGKEYLNYSSIAISNALSTGFSVRGTMNINSTSLNTMRGYGATVQKSFSDFADVSLRYQTYRYYMKTLDESTKNSSLGMDILFSMFQNMTLWGSVERTFGSDANSTSIFMEVSWRF